MRSITKHCLVCGGVAAVTAVAIGVLHQAVARHLVGLALDRREPKGLRKHKARLGRSKALSETFQTIRHNIEDMQKRSYQTVELCGNDGVKLVGHWYAAPHPKRVIIAMHGWRSSWDKDFGGIAEFWESSDCSVLYAEQRGQGVSGGDHMGFGLLERYDCLGWIRWVLDTCGEQYPIYLCGVSMGASTVLMTAGFDLPGAVHGIIADCGFTSPQAIWKHVVERNLHLPYGIYRAAADDLCRKRLQIGAQEYSCVDAMRVCRVPVMFVHGANDRFVPIEMTYENYEACIAPKRLYVVPGATHAMSYAVDKSGYENAMSAFWKDYDG